MSSMEYNNGSTVCSVKRVRHKSGNASYADIIMLAISSSKFMQMTLAEIYDWMATNVPGLEAQRHVHSSKGWKNAVRHTLSINRRFKKIARVGRPGFWTFEPEKNRKSPGFRPRSASMPSVPSTASFESPDISYELKLSRSLESTKTQYTLSCNVNNFSKNDVAQLPSLLKSQCATTVASQNVAVSFDSGKVGVVIVPKPVAVRIVRMIDASTQTESQYMIETPPATFTDETLKRFTFTFPDLLSTLINDTITTQMFDTNFDISMNKSSAFI